MKKADVSIIFVYYNSPSEILDVVNSIKKAIKKFSYEIIIVDNGSTKKLPEEIFNIEKIIYIKNKNVGYGMGLNKGAEKACGKYLLLTNPDLIFEKNSIEILLARMESDNSIGIIGPAFLDEKKRIRKVGNSMPAVPDVIFALSSLNKLFPGNLFSKKYFLSSFDRRTEKEIPVLCGACMIVRSEIFKKIKGFDKRFFRYFEEADICYRISKLGLKIVYYPLSRVTHFVGRSSQDLKWITNTYEKSRLEFLRKYYGFVIGTLTEGIIRAINLPARFI